MRGFVIFICLTLGSHALGDFSGTWNGSGRMVQVQKRERKSECDEVRVIISEDERHLRVTFPDDIPCVAIYRKPFKPLEFMKENGMLFVANSTESVGTYGNDRVEAAVITLHPSGHGSYPKSEELYLRLQNDKLELKRTYSMSFRDFYVRETLSGILSLE